MFWKESSVSPHMPPSLILFKKTDPKYLNIMVFLKEKAMARGTQEACMSDFYCHASVTIPLFSSFQYPSGKIRSPSPLGRKKTNYW